MLHALRLYLLMPLVGLVLIVGAALGIIGSLGLLRW
jgi:hypothetical protein